MLEDLKAGLLKYEIAGEFLVDIKKEFGGEDKKPVKIAKLRRIEQEGKIMEEFVQELRKAARKSKYERRLLVKEFKRGINNIIQRRLIKAKCQPNTIEQWYNQAIILNRNLKKSRREKERRTLKTRTNIIEHSVLKLGQEM